MGFDAYVKEGDETKTNGGMYSAHFLFIIIKMPYSGLTNNARQKCAWANM